MPPSFQVPKKIAAVSGVGGRTTATRSPLLDPVLAKQVRRLVREVLQLAPVELAGGAVVALPDHRRLVARVLVADVGGDVVALGHAPLVLGARLLVGLDPDSVVVIGSPLANSPRPYPGQPRSSHPR